MQYRVKVDSDYPTETKKPSVEQVDQLPTGRSRSATKNLSSRKRQLPSDHVDVQEEDSCSLASASDQGSGCHKTARTNSGYAEGEEENDSNRFNSQLSEIYQKTPLDEKFHSRASAKMGFFTSFNMFDCIYPDILPFHHRNTAAKNASRHNARLQSLLKIYLQVQRLSNQNLLSCDCNQIERDIARGVPPTKKMKRRHICVLCVLEMMRHPLID